MSERPLNQMNTSIRISADVLSQEVAGETVLLDLASESYFGLDEVGTRVWQMLKTGRDPEVIVESLLTEYEVSRERLEADVIDSRLQPGGS